MSDTRHPEYALGHTQEELDRLDRQGAILRPLTTRMLREAGVEAGMRVLDVGCGTGDLSLVVRELVGAGGHVTGLDRAPEAVATSRDRFTAKGLVNADFVQGDIDSVAFEGRFDAVVGRLVLMYLPDPAAALRRISAFVRPGGLLAFIDIIMPPAALHGSGVFPLVDQAQSWVATAFQRAGFTTDMGLRQIHAFEDAGLGRPEFRIEGMHVTNDDVAKIHWLAGTVRSLLPIIVKTGIATEAEVDIDTLADRLVAEASTVRTTVFPLAYGCAWTRTSSA